MVRESAHGCRRSQKSELIAKGIIRKIQDQPEQTTASYSDKYSESVRLFAWSVCVLVSVKSAHASLRRGVR